MAIVDRPAGSPPGPRFARMLVDPRSFEVSVSSPDWPTPDDRSQFPLLVDVDAATQKLEARRVTYLTVTDGGNHVGAQPGNDALLQNMAQAEQETIARLTKREREVLTELARGASNSAIARTLNISVGTVRVHVKSVLRKLSLENRTQAAVWATAIAAQQET